VKTYIIFCTGKQHLSKYIEHKQFTSGFTLYPFTATEHFDVKTPKYNVTFFSKYSPVQFLHLWRSTYMLLTSRSHDLS